MKKSKHKWHCGVCGNDLVALKKGKGTKYLHCGYCDQIIAYYNKGLLGKVAKGALRGVPFVGDIAAELITKEPKAATPTIKTQRMTTEERTLLVDKLLRGR